jgi:porphobilinogen synthase
MGERNLLHAGFHSDTLRYWQQYGASNIDPRQLIYPVFITDSSPDAWEPIPSMPEQYRVGINRLAELILPLYEMGLSTVLLFGVISDQSMKDDRGSLADDPDRSPVLQALRLLRQQFPKLCLACDVCLCPYTNHGHCGLLYADGTVCNEKSALRLAEISVCYAEAGCQLIAPSDMMDGRIREIKRALCTNLLGHRVAVMSYSAKFASAFYGPFRDAAKSSPQFGDRRCYQLPPGARGLARRALLRDLDEGADILMIKPGYPYLDIVRDARELASDHPIAVYQVSNSYSIMHSMEI